MTFVIGISCSSPEEKQVDLATTGTIDVGVDDVYLPLLKSQVFIFENLYRNAKINLAVEPELQVINSFVNGNAPMIVSGQLLSKEEIDHVGKNNFSVYQTKIALDAVVLIANKSLPDSSLTLDQVKQIFKGSKKFWNEINPSLPKEPIRIVIDQNNSSNLLYLNNKIGIQPDVLFSTTAGSVQKIFDHIKEEKYSIGVVGWSWVSDEEDPKTIEYLKNVKVIALGTDLKHCYLPSQEVVNDSLYPFIRPIYSINKGARAGLGSGFSSFMASDRGQRIVLKHGIVPAIIPGREIELK